MINYYLCVLIFCWLSLLILAILVYENDRLSLRAKGMFYLTFALISAAAYAEYCGVMLDGKEEYPSWGLMVAKCADYSLTPMCVVALANMRIHTIWKKTMTRILLLNAVFQVFGVIFGWTVSIDEHHYYHHGPLFPVYILICLVIIVLLSVQFIQYGKNFRRQNRLSLYCIMLLVVLSIIIQESSINCRIVYLGMTLAAALLFIHYTEFSQLAADDVLSEQRVQLMLSQIKPHFLYNVLGSIEMLCDMNPKAAKLATRKFSRYLRGNMDAISGPSQIPFERELQHTQLYLDLEQTRFEDALQVRQKIDVKDFFLPPLTLEPIVENAVKHGIRRNPDGRGMIQIETEELEDCYEIRVIDNGAGFESNALPDGREHVGIRNVTERLEQICGGSLQIDSTPGKGTTAIIRIPKQ